MNRSRRLDELVIQLMQHLIALTSESCFTNSLTMRPSARIPPACSFACTALITGPISLGVGVWPEARRARQRFPRPVLQASFVQRLGQELLESRQRSPRPPWPPGRAVAVGELLIESRRRACIIMVSVCSSSAGVSTAFFSSALFFSAVLISRRVCALASCAFMATTVNCNGCGECAGIDHGFLSNLSILIEVHRRLRIWYGCDDQRLKDAAGPRIRFQ